MGGKRKGEETIDKYLTKDIKTESYYVCIHSYVIIWMYRWRQDQSIS